MCVCVYIYIYIYHKAFDCLKTHSVLVVSIMHTCANVMVCSFIVLYNSVFVTSRVYANMMVHAYTIAYNLVFGIIFTYANMTT